MNFVSGRMEKIKAARLKSIEEHNQRTGDFDVKTVNHDNTKNNIVLLGKNKNIENAVLERLKKKNVKRVKSGKNESVVAVELVISATPTFFRDNEKDYGVYNEEKTMEWAKANLDYLKKKHGNNLIRVDLHLDESTPHIHAIITPIVTKERKKRRTKAQIKNNEKSETYTVTQLDCKNMYNRQALIDLQTEIAKAVENQGLTRGIRGSKSKYQKNNRYWSIIKRIFNTKLTFSNNNLALNIKINSKPLFKSIKQHLIDEEKRINNKLKKDYAKQLKKVENLARAAIAIKEEIKVEKNKTSFIAKKLDGMSLDEFIEKQNTMIGNIKEEKKDAINKLKDKLKEEEKKVESLVAKNELKDKQINKMKKVYNEVKHKLDGKTPKY